DHINAQGVLQVEVDLRPQHGHVDVALEGRGIVEGNFHRKTHHPHRVPPLRSGGAIRQLEKSIFRQPATGDKELQLFFSRQRLNLLKLDSRLDVGGVELVLQQALHDLLVVPPPRRDPQSVGSVEAFRSKLEAEQVTRLSIRRQSLCQRQRQWIVKTSQRTHDPGHVRLAGDLFE